MSKIECNYHPRGNKRQDLSKTKGHVGTLSHTLILNELIFSTNAWVWVEEATALGLEILNLLLAEENILLDIINNLGCTPFYNAAEKGTEGVVSTLLARGASLNTEVNYVCLPPITI